MPLSVGFARSWWAIGPEGGVLSRPGFQELLLVKFSGQEVAEMGSVP
jgi:hypothetical protein